MGHGAPAQEAQKSPQMYFEDSFFIKEGWILMDLKDREKIFTYLNNYTEISKEQIDRSNTKQPLLKSYVFETFDPELSKGDIDIFGISDLFNQKQFKLKQIDEGFYILNHCEKEFAFFEKLNERFFVMYSLEKAGLTDSYASKLVNLSPLIDNLWISGKMFDTLLLNIMKYHNPRRYTKINFEFDDHFNTEQEGEQDFLEDKISRISLTKDLTDVRNNLEGIRGYLPEFHCIGMLRFPSRIGKGGHDFYQNGKVTNRSNDFRDHRLYITENMQFYKSITEEIERKVWLDFEPVKAPDASYSMAFKGVPVVFKFNKVIKDTVFRNFINSTFPKGKAPFRILGEPIWLGEHRVHVYGVDLHLWQEVMLDLSPSQFTVFIPRGTCGNTIHRLITNIQRYLSPHIEVMIGNTSYEKLLKKNMGLNDNE